MIDFISEEVIFKNTEIVVRNDIIISVYTILIYLIKVQISDAAIGYFTARYLSLRVSDEGYLSKVPGISWKNIFFRRIQGNIA